MTVSRQRQRHIIEFSLLALIVLIGAYLRMGQPGIVEFKRDEANLSLLALEMVHEGHVPLLGITSSVGLPNAPMNVYVLSLPYFISDSPLVATQFIGLLNVIAVALTYGLMRWYVGVWPALMVILLFTTSPWGVMFSRKIWAQNMLPPFVIAVAGCAILGYIERKRWAQVAVWPLLAITGQIHYGAVVIVPAVAMALWLGRRRIAWTPTIVGLLMALVVTLPYLVGLARADLLSLDALHKAVQTDVTTADSAPWYEPLRQAGMIVSGVEIHALTGPERFLDFLATVPDAYPLFWLITVAVGAGTVWLIARAFRVTDRRTSVDLVVVVWLVAPIIIYLFDWTTFYIHYLIPMLPAAFIVLAISFSDLISYSEKEIRSTSVIIASRVGGGAIVTLIAGLQIVMVIGLLHFVNTEYTPGGFGTPLHLLMNVRGDVRIQPYESIIGEVGGQNIGFDDGPTIWSALLYTERTRLRFADQATTVYPEGQTIVIDTDCQGEEVTRLRSPEEGCYSVSERSQAEFSPVDYQIAEDVIVFANGVRLQGYKTAYQEDGLFCTTLMWEITAIPEQNAMFAVHLFNQNDRIGIADGPSWPIEFWRVDDLIVRDYCTIPERNNVTSVQVGMYILQPDGNFSNISIGGQSSAMAKFSLNNQNSHSQ